MKTRAFEDVAAQLRRQGLKWEEVQAKVEALGYTGPNGKPFNNGYFVSATLKKYPELKVNTRQTESVAEKPAKPGRPAGSLSYKQKITGMKKLGFSAEAILKALET